MTSTSSLLAVIFESFVMGSYQHPLALVLHTCTVLQVTLLTPWLLHWQNVQGHNSIILHFMWILLCAVAVSTAGAGTCSNHMDRL